MSVTPERESIAGLPPGVSVAVPDPCLLVIFGASGDLTARKLLPALGRLAADGTLAPEVTLVGVARTALTDDEFRSYRLRFGIYGQRQAGVQMVRVKIPGGLLTREQVDQLAFIADEFGGPNALGTTINIPLPPETSDEGFLYVLEELILPIMSEFKPDLVINSAGQDNHYTDPITNMRFSAQGYARLNERLNPDIAVIVLTMFEDDDLVLAGLRAGARGYILKGADQTEILRAIGAAVRGEALFGAPIAQRLMHFFSAPRPSLPAQAFPELTEREREVLEYIAQGLTNREIAEKMVISEKTVKTHVSNILGKLHLANRTQAALYALREGISGLAAEPA